MANWDYGEPYWVISRGTDVLFVPRGKGKPVRSNDQYFIFRESSAMFWPGRDSIHNVPDGVCRTLAEKGVYAGFPLAVEGFPRYASVWVRKSKLKRF